MGDNLKAGQILFMSLPPPIQLMIKRVAGLKVSLEAMIEDGRLNAENLGEDDLAWLQKAVKAFDRDLFNLGLMFPGETPADAEKAAGKLWGPIVNRETESVAVKSTKGQLALVAGELEIVAAIQAAVHTSGCMVGDISQPGLLELDSMRAINQGKKWAEENVPPETLKKAKAIAATKMLEGFFSKLTSAKMN